MLERLHEQGKAILFYVSTHIVSAQMEPLAEKYKENSLFCQSASDQPCPYPLIDDEGMAVNTDIDQECFTDRRIASLLPV